ncbi:MAG: MFS transporter [Desulfobacterales bacterium]|nr:MFS transporter [Desulfobacterales bacterium]
MIPTQTAESGQTQMPPFRSQLGTLFFLASIFYLNFVSRIIMAPLMPTVEKELHFSHGEAGSLFLVLSLGYFTGLIFSGFISSRFTHRKTILISIIAVGLTLIAASRYSSLWTFWAVIVFLGLFAGLYLASGIATLTAQIDSGHWGKALAIHELGPTVSFLTAPLIAEGLLNWFSWRGVLVTLGVVYLLLGAAYARYGKGGDVPGKAPKLETFRVLLKNRGFWIMLFMFGLGIGGTIGIYTMLPLYLVVEKDLERNWANMLIAISRIGCPGIVFAAGWSTDGFGTQRTLFGVFLLTGLATISLGLTENRWLVFFVILQPLLASCFFPAGFAALSRSVPAAIQNVAVSFTVPFGFIIGGGLFPVLIGITGDAAAFAAGIIIVGCFILSGAFLTRFLPRFG